MALSIAKFILTSGEKKVESQDHVDGINNVYKIMSLIISF